MSEGKLPRVPDYLDHILQTILRIDRYTEDLTEVTFGGRKDAGCGDSKY
jgi:uncharacterized protein with HEPN domain